MYRIKALKKLDKSEIRLTILEYNENSQKRICKQGREYLANDFIKLDRPCLPDQTHLLRLFWY